MELKKDIIIEFVDEDISELLAEQNRKEFISELNSLELKYSVENIVRNYHFHLLDTTLLTMVCLGKR